MMAVNFILPPNQELKRVSIRADSTVAEAIEQAKLHFAADPDKVYGAQSDPDEPCLELSFHINDHDGNWDLWIVEMIEIHDEFPSRISHFPVDGAKAICELIEDKISTAVLVDKFGIEIYPGLHLGSKELGRHICHFI
jgi:hypothetical protein